MQNYRDQVFLEDDIFRVFMKQIVEGVVYIHRNSIVHLDLKVTAFYFGH